MVPLLEATTSVQERLALGQYAVRMHEEWSHEWAAFLLPLAEGRLKSVQRRRGSVQQVRAAAAAACSALPEGSSRGGARWAMHEMGLALRTC